MCDHHLAHAQHTGAIAGDRYTQLAVQGPRARDTVQKLTPVDLSGIKYYWFTDGEVCDWVLKNVKKPESVKAAHRDRMLNYPKKDDQEMQARLKLRKENAGLAHRDDIQSFVDFIDADEKRN